MSKLYLGDDLIASLEASDILYDSSTTVKSKIDTLNTNISGKAPTSHASSATTYGVGTTRNYGHCMTINNLTTSSHANGKALSAYQGYVLKNSIDDLNNLISSSNFNQPELLWENNSPASSFEASTISMDLSEYKRFIVVIRYSTSTTDLAERTISEKGYQYRLDVPAGSIYLRYATVTDTGITFGSGANVKTYGSGTTDNSVAIPYKIYGYK